jgi:hypothetical protein
MHEAPTIVKASERVLVEIEGAVRGFSRYHKYAVGAELRSEARRVARLANRAWRDHHRRAEWLSRLSFAIDDLKLSLQIAKRVEAFTGFKQFQALARIVYNLGQQCGGWQRRHSCKGQNSQTNTSAGRAQTLSARDASQEAIS